MAPNGDCGRSRTSRIRRHGVVRTCSTCTRRVAAQGSTGPSTVSGSWRPTPVRLAVSRRDGFTLIELMVVMALIVVLASIGLTLYANSVTRAKESVLKEHLFRMRDAIDQYYADKGKYPATLQDLVSDKYLRTIPADPFTNSPE